MTGLYLFAAAAGVPLVAWFLLSGGDDSGGEDGHGIGGVMLRLLPLSTIAIAMATFGVAGLVLGFLGTSSTATFLGAAATAVVVGIANTTIFGYLRRSEWTATVGDEQLSGAIGRVVLPVSAEHRGRIAVSAGGQQLYLSARVLPDDPTAQLDVGTPVLVVEVRDGVASVTRLDPELT